MYAKFIIHIKSFNKQKKKTHKIFKRVLQQQIAI